MRPADAAGQKTPSQNHDKRVDQARGLGESMRAGFMFALAAAAWLGTAAVVLAQEDVERFTDGDATKGAPLYKRYCSGCHGADGRGGAHTFMPHIASLTRSDYIEFIPDGYLFTVIAEGGEAVGKSDMMPAWKATLSEQDIKDIIAHIRSLPTY
jgi:cytochrome c oxidase cbb3-type subunit 3